MLGPSISHPVKVIFWWHDGRTALSGFCRYRHGHGKCKAICRVSAIPSQKHIHLMYDCGGNMIGVCYFVLRNSMCRKRRLCEIGNILCRAIQFFRSFESVQTETGPALYRHAKPLLLRARKHTQRTSVFPAPTIFESTPISRHDQDCWMVTKPASSRMRFRNRPYSRSFGRDVAMSFSLLAVSGHSIPNGKAREFYNILWKKSRWIGTRPNFAPLTETPPRSRRPIFT